ncbi:type II toxin-antitoxin system PemK/MazF family toxin [Isoptericola chiayiensis]|uniref:mRNA interferase n=1 Tax=Isoptericola chiayiensis TaxID=579446 RepID=A0ABP8Y655_9MICO|nr:type II toxin-antitoxin system PemK/MazF family toxin [Isoptericola chiayiensis]NOW00637.1 mRNA interferase MazF [Isoptericola chiayiensis]
MKVAAGDILWVDLSPTKGHEQRGHRPVLVISETPTNHTFAIVVPLTSRDKGYPTSHRLRTEDPEQISVALCQQVRTIDVRQRVTGRLGAATRDDLDAVRDIVARLIGRYT